MSKVLKNGTLVLFNQNEKSTLVIEDNKIKWIGDYFEPQTQEIDCSNLKIFPGFIDIHTHGGYGYDFEQNDVNSYFELAKNLSKEGVTKFLLSSVTNPIDSIKNCCITFSEFFHQQNEFIPKCLGIHLEGPFISVSKKGAHKQDLIIKPNIEIFDEIQFAANNLIKMVTYDVDADLDGSFAQHLINNNVIAAVGHSNASADTFLNSAIKYGVNHITHLYNGMSLFDTRNPGIATVALTNKQVLCELICDGLHVDKEMVKLAFLCKGPFKICLITDSMIAKNQPDGSYLLGSLAVTKKGEKCVLKDTNTLAGSVAKYNICFKNFHDWILPTDQILSFVSSYNAAKQLKLENVGIIKQDYIADLVLVNSEYEVVATICEGEFAYIRSDYVNQLKIKEVNYE